MLMSVYNIYANSSQISTFAGYLKKVTPVIKSDTFVYTKIYLKTPTDSCDVLLNKARPDGAAARLHQERKVCGSPAARLMTDV